MEDPDAEVEEGIAERVEIVFTERLPVPEEDALEVIMEGV